MISSCCRDARACHERPLLVGAMWGSPPEEFTRNLGLESDPFRAARVAKKQLISKRSCLISKRLCPCSLVPPAAWQLVLSALTLPASLWAALRGRGRSCRGVGLHRPEGAVRLSGILAWAFVFVRAGLCVCLALSVWPCGQSVAPWSGCRRQRRPATSLSTGIAEYCLELTSCLAIDQICASCALQC